MGDPDQASEADDEGQAPEGDSVGDSAPDAPPKKYTLAPLPGGELPDVGTLFNETLAEFQDNLGPYVLASLGHTMVVIPTTILAIFVMYFLMFASMMVGMMGSVGVGAVVAETISQDLGALIMGVGYMLSLFLPFLMMFVVLGGMLAVLAPVTASLSRAVAAHQRGEGELELSSAFTTVTQDLVPTVLVAAIIGSLTGIGMLFFFLPGLMVPVLLGFATSLVFLHRQGAIQGVRTALQHAMAHLNWHVSFGLLYLVMTMFASYLPIIGPAFVIAFHVRAYRTVFGDGPEPVTTVA